MRIRRTTFIEYFLPAVPFGVLAVMAVMKDIARSRGGRWASLAFLGIVGGAFVVFYPIWSAWPLPQQALSGSTWFWLERWR
jgi:dolichyl-phosphate-mannose--protein O-mannosyl transferase